MRKYIAEFLGTFVLVFVACGVAAVTGCSGIPDSAYILTALAFGGVVIAMAYSIGNISGCHINPAVSLGALLAGRMKIRECIAYMAAQFLGGAAGALLLRGVLGKVYSLGANGIYDGSIGKTILIEAILTFLFVFTVLGVTAEKANTAVSGIVIGAALTLVHLFGIHFTGTSVNPARSLGPALMMGGESLKNVWVFILAPLLGGGIAAGVYRFLHIKNEGGDVYEEDSKAN